MDNFFATAEAFGKDGKYLGKIENGKDLECYLKAVFNATEYIYGKRPRTPEEKDQKDLREEYEALLTDIEEKWKKEMLRIGPDHERDLEKLYCLVKGNLLLRKGQREDALYADSEESYQQAVCLLRRHVKKSENDTRDVIDLLIQVCLGKYFRNLGHYKKRSHFHMAVYELQKVIQWLQEEQHTYDRQKTLIWLDVMANIGRAYKNLYNLAESKRYFGEIIYAVSPKIGDKAEDILRQVKELELEIDIRKEALLLCESESGDRMYESYLIQALVQLAIVYRKERNYHIAESLCHAVIRMDGGNIDARNNLGVCYRKQGNYTIAISEIGPLNKDGNSFAEINYWKCKLQQIARDDEITEDTKREFDQFVEKSGADREIRLLQGRFLLIENDTEAALCVFRKLYEESPYINPGTIGLKAYYNIANCLIRQEKYQQAEKILREILNICEDDRLARIDLGWCMMKMNQYIAAGEEYEKLLRIESETTLEELKERIKLPDWPRFERMKVRNNLGECYLRGKEIAKARLIFEEVCLEENENVEAISFLAQCDLMEGEEARRCKKYDEARRFYMKAIERLERTTESKKKDIQPMSGLIAARSTYLEIISENNDEESEDYRKAADNYKKYIESCLLYYPEIRYTQKACYEIARFLKELNDDEETNILYRAFAHIRLWEKEEGCHAFSHFMDSQVFLCMGATMRGKILMYLFLIYGAVMRIKEECRYSPDASCKEMTIPRHYTTMDTLKILLATQTPEGEQSKENKVPKLRLWNSVYMNDPYEGVSFLDLLMNQNGEGGGNVLDQYFPYLKNNEKNLNPVNGNVYITSLTNQKDDLLMWMTYADQAQGCNIVFADDFFDIRSKLDGPMGFPVYSDEDYPLYEVQYIDVNEAKKGKIKIAVMDEGANADQHLRMEEARSKAKRIESGMKDLWENIQVLEGYLIAAPEIKESGKDTIRGFIADAINEVRFLFKYDEYNREQEMRMVRYSYEPAFEEKFDIPRMYVEVERDIRIKEVMLGPKISPEKTDEIVAWLYSTGKVEKVTKSEKHFR